jgi:hypothetical protein
LSPRGLSILAAMCLIAGVVLIASGAGVGLRLVSHTFPWAKGPLVVDCGQPFPPRGSDKSFILQPVVMARVAGDAPEVLNKSITTIDEACAQDRGIMTDLMVGLAGCGVVLGGLGGVLLFLRALPSRRPQPWPQVR